MVLNSTVMSFSQDTSHSSPLISRAYDFAQSFAADGPEFLASHLPDWFFVGTPSKTSVVQRDQFIEAAQGRAALVTGLGLAGPSLVNTTCEELGDSYCLVTANWQMTLPDATTADLVEDFLIDRSGTKWVCLAYLLRQDLPGMLAN